jgi:hypothetical protein
MSRNLLTPSHNWRLFRSISAIPVCRRLASFSGFSRETVIATENCQWLDIRHKLASDGSPAPRVGHSRMARRVDEREELKQDRRRFSKSRVDSPSLGDNPVFRAQSKGWINIG